MFRYEQDPARGRVVAVFPGERRVVVNVSRGRGYPLLRGPAPDTADAYHLAAERLKGTAGRVADLGAGAGHGTTILRAAGFEVVGFDCAPEAVEFATLFAPEISFVQCAIERAPVHEFDALLLMDVIGLVADDTTMMRALARNAAPGTPVIGAVTRAAIDRTLIPPCRRAYSPEALDALLVRSGWQAPVLLAKTADWWVFETRRAERLEVAEVLLQAERVACSPAGARSVAEALAKVVERTEDPSEVRELLLALGWLLLERGEFDPAEQAFAAANAIAPACARSYVALAALACARGQYNDAEALFDHALGFDAAHTDAWLGLARVSVRLGDTGRAIESLECALALDPSRDDVVTTLARLRLQLRDPEGAVRAIERLLSYGECHPWLQTWYAWLVASNRGRSVPSVVLRTERTVTGGHVVAEGLRAARTLSS